MASSYPTGTMLEAAGTAPGVRQVHAAGKYQTMKVARPLSAYTCFVRELQPKLTTSHPEKSFQNVAAMIGQMWQELSDAGRQPYKQLAARDMRRFKTEKLACIKAGMPF